MQHINSFSGGMKRGIDYTLMPQDSYSFMLNGYLVSRDNHGYVVTAIKGNKEIAQFDVDECPIGSVSFNGVLYIITHKIVSENGSICFYSLNGTNGNGWIVGEMKIIPNGPDNELIISDTVLGITRDKLIEVFAKQSYDGSVDLYICNGLSPNVVINTGINQLGFHTERKYVTLSDAPTFQLQKLTSTIPQVNHEILNTGNLKPGTYYFYLRYEDESLNSTPFIKEYGPIVIHSGSKTNNSAVGVANENNAKLSKSIKLSITNADIRYNKISVGVVFYYGSNGIVSRDNYLIDKSYTLKNNSVTIVFTGDNGIRSLLVEEIISDNLQYNISETHLQFENRYYGANWKGKELNYNILREFAKRIIPYAVLDTEDNFDKVYDSSNRKHEYMENEIYPFGVSFLIEGRYKTPVFPIYGWYEGVNDITYLSRQVIDVPGHYETPPVVPFDVVMFTWQSSGWYGSPNQCGVDLDGIAPAGGIGFNFAAVHNGTSVVSYFTVELNEGDWNGFFTFPEVASNYTISFAYVLDNSIVKYAYRHLTDWTVAVHPIPTYQPNDIWIDNTYKNGPTFESENPINNGLGLYKFPEKLLLINEGVVDNGLHFKLMGLKFDYSKAYEYLASLVNNIPNITGFYMVQGDRKKNVITQGFSVAAVESVGYHAKVVCRVDDVANYNHHISSNIDLGNNNNKVAFPFLDGSDYRLFPVAKINRTYDGSGDDADDYSFSIQEDDITRLTVFSKGEQIQETAGHPLVEAFDLSVVQDHANTQLENLSLEQDSKLKNVNTNKFCIYTPDILMDNNLLIPETVYIKPVKNINLLRGDDFSFNKSTNVGNIAISSGLLHRGKYHTGSNLFRILDSFPRYHSPEKGFYTKKNSKVSVYKGVANIINYKEISANGFSSKMRSLHDVFGYDMKRDDQSQSPIMDNYFNSSREQLFKAGILLNRTKRTLSDNDTNNPALTVHDYSYKLKSDRLWWNKYCAFGHPQAVMSTKDNISLPLVFTNLSMESIPYIGITFDFNGSYSTEANYNLNIPIMGASGKFERGFYNSNLNLRDYRDMHNAIVNVCAYRNLDEYIEAVIGSFNIESESFAIIDYKENDDTQLLSNILFKGDMFSQKTAMRCMRWTSVPESVIDDVLKANWEAGWKYGSGFNMYLQSTVNTFLRLSEFDSDYLPHALKTTNSGVLEEKINDFIWKNSSDKNSRESWITNEGYHQLKGLIRLPAFDDLFLRKEFKSLNRIYFSNKHVDGSFVDAYREFPIGQYQDFNFENGEILKLIKTNNYLFSIQKSSINQHFGSSELMQSSDSSSIIIGDKNILSDKYRQLSEFGTQHKESVVNGELGIYGIDWNKERIWRIKGAATMSGATTFGIETLEVSKSISDIFKWLKTVLNGSLLPQDLMGEVATGIHSVYDEKNKQILFTFKLGLCLVNEATTVDGVPVPAMYDELSYTLAFSEEFDTFIGFYSFNKNIYLKFDNRLLSFTKGDKNLWEHNIGDYQSIDGVIQPFVLEVIINGSSKEQNLGNYEKEFLSHIMNSSPEDINSITWETEYQESEKNPFIDAAEFWSNPEYKEHNWYIPIIENTNSNKGPKSNEEFNTFEPSSKMRGQWLKFKVTYIPEEGISQEHQFYVRSLITNLIISFT